MTDKPKVIVIDGGLEGRILATIIRRAGYEVEGLTEAFDRMGKAAIEAQIHVEQFEQLGNRMAGLSPNLMIIDDPWGICTHHNELKSLTEACVINARDTLPASESAHSLERPHGWYRQFEKRNGKRNK